MYEVNLPELPSRVLCWSTPTVHHRRFCHVTLLCPAPKCPLVSGVAVPALAVQHQSIRRLSFTASSCSHGGVYVKSMLDLKKMALASADPTGFSWLM